METLYSLFGCCLAKITLGELFGTSLRNTVDKQVVNSHTLWDQASFDIWYFSLWIIFFVSTGATFKFWETFLEDFSFYNIHIYIYIYKIYIYIRVKTRSKTNSINIKK